MKMMIFKIYKNKIKPFMIILIFSFLLIILNSAYINADSPTYNTDRYNVDVEINKDNSFNFKEMIDVDFTSPSHGIYRNIPISSKYDIKNIVVRNHYFTILNKENNKVIRIGDPDKLVEGKESYIIKYKIAGYSQGKKDYLYLDILPTGWATSIGSVTANIKLPEDMPMDKIKVYSGKYKSSGNKELQYGEVQIDEENHTIHFYAENLPSNVGVSIGSELPSGYWQGAKSKGLITISLLSIFSILIIILRLTWGRNPRVTNVVEFNPPEDLPPMELGYVIDGIVDKNDISSTLFYLANKGFINIKQTGKDNFKFILKDYPKNEKKSAQLFFDGIFGDKASKGEVNKDKTVTKDNIGTGIGEKLTDIEGAVEAEFTGQNKIFSKKSKKADSFSKTIFFIGNMIVFLTFRFYMGLDSTSLSVIIFDIIFALVYASVATIPLYVLINAYYHKYSGKKSSALFKILIFTIPYILVALGLSYYTCARNYSINDPKVWLIYILFLLIAPIFICGMRSRTDENARLLGRILGFKNFIANAEISKLEELIEDDPNYFYNILPYAYIFGLTKKWASKFDDIIKDENPEWYETTDSLATQNLYNTAVLTSMVDSISHGMIGSMNVTDSDSGGGFFSGGGGFSGGGFTGGGFGGGGGGAW